MRSESFSSITWQGETFGLRRSYASWETYKKGRHQLLKRELPRVRQKMAAIAVPAHFKNHATLIRGLMGLQFPGYGCSFNGQVKDAEGGAYELAEFDVPDAGEVRALLYRKNDDGSFALVMDRICPIIHPDYQLLVRLDGQWRVEEGCLRVYVDDACFWEASF